MNNKLEWSMEDGETILIKDKIFREVIPPYAIGRAVLAISSWIKEYLEFGNYDPVLLVVLDGSMMFASDIIKNVGLVDLRSVKVTSYSGDKRTGSLDFIYTFDKEKIKGKDIIIIEDIIDTGHTLNALCEDLGRTGVNSVAIVTMFDKPEAREVEDLPISCVGFKIPNEFVVGYGLDYNGLGRGLTGLYTFHAELESKYK